MKKMHTLEKLAREIMRERGLEPEFSDEELEQVSKIAAPAPINPADRDLRSLLWCSIDNDDSRDLDQLTFAEKLGDGKMLLWVAVADVSALVAKNSPVDIHAEINTTSVYTPAKVFSMLPEKLSTNFTSLNEGEERSAVVTKIQVGQAGEIEDFQIFQAAVVNQAKLAYGPIGKWLAGEAPLPEKVKRVPGLEDALKIQHAAAQLLRERRHEGGSLTLESPEAEVKILSDEQIVIEHGPHNFAHQLIEEFMIAANRAMAAHFQQANIASLRRVVRIPRDWDRIVEIAKEHGADLPKKPDAKALDRFLVNRKKRDPVSFPDLSLTVIKLLGKGEYVVENDVSRPLGHFALALSDYMHSTAPNRRFPDLISQRQCLAILRGEENPYSLEELYLLAAHCTSQEDAAMKVERQVNKSAAAMLLADQIGETFKGIITGASGKGTWVRLFKPAVEGKVIEGSFGLRVGDRVQVVLKFVDIPRGFIDFACLGKKKTGQLP